MHPGRSSLSSAVPALLMVFLIAGCGSAERAGRPARIVKVSGDDATGGCRKTTAKAMKVRVLSPRIRGLLGGKGNTYPVAGVKVKFELIEGPEDAVITPEETETDAGGIATASVNLGSTPADHLVKVFLPGHGNVRPAFFRAASGVEVLGDGQEGWAGQPLENPIGVCVVDHTGAPVAGKPVSFRVVSGKHARLSKELEYTNEEGVAAVDLTLGSSAGTYMVEVTPVGARGAYRPFTIKAVALEGWGALIGVLGGLAVFILGLRTMSDGLQKVAGSRLRAILGHLTRNRFVGVLTGLGVTALIQSSSATTVMLVGFVNAGLVTLTQAVGVVMGANIGTTVTAQIISFKLIGLAFPAVALGLMMEMVGKRRNVRFWGQVLWGFGLLFLGMDLMKAVLKTLADSPTVHSLFSAIDCTPDTGGHMPVGAIMLGIIFGTVLTMVVQSSSATIGLLMALAGAGFINYWSAIPILFGDNIGTTITAQLAALGANRAARRTAMVHTLFNLVGVLYMCLLFYITWNGKPVYLELIDRFTPGDAFGAENIERHIANAHTVFNLVNTAILLPFAGLLGWIALRIIPLAPAEQEEEIAYLEPHLLDTPPLAIRQVFNELVYMGQLGQKSLREAYAAVHSGDLSVGREVARREEKIDRRQAAISDYVVQLSQRDLAVEESRQVPHLLHSNNDFERIGDHAENFMELAERKAERSLPFSDTAKKELDEYFGEMDEMFSLVLSSLKDFNTEDVVKALKKEEYLNATQKGLEGRHFERLEAGDCDPLAGLVFLDLIANIEKVGDHLTNIAEAVMELSRVRNGSEE